jgi:protocatechuate 3,4-dioxygenase, alpha subunit
MELIHTANQPIGPFFHFALTPDNTAGAMAGAETKGERVRLVCRLLDRDGGPVTNGMIELWQADAGGK